MRYLVVDIGNTLSKIAVFEDRELLFLDSYSTLSIDILSQILKSQSAIGAAIVGSSGIDSSYIVDYLRDSSIPVVEKFSHLTPIPLKNLYQTPKTLGLDRLAVAVAASEKFIDEDIIIFDLGTAITVDYISRSGEYLGGNISPGLTMRFEALSHFTSRLPLIEKSSYLPLFDSYVEQFLGSDFKKRGSSTIEAIFFGVVGGICFEIEGYISENSEKRVFFTGGDAVYFEKLIKMPIFVDYWASISGMRTILERSIKI